MAIRQYALEESIEHLLTMYRNPDEIAYRAPILAGLVGLLMTVSQCTVDAVIPVDENPLAKFKDSILGALMSGLKVSESQSQNGSMKAALEGSYHLIRTPGVLSAEELGYLTHNVNELVAKPTTNFDDIR